MIRVRLGCKGKGGGRIVKLSCLHFYFFFFEVSSFYVFKASHLCCFDFFGKNCLFSDHFETLFLPLHALLLIISEKQLVRSHWMLAEAFQNDRKKAISTGVYLTYDHFFDNFMGRNFFTL